MNKLLYLSLFILILSFSYHYLNKDTTEPESLTGKNVVITGASSGIGEELAYRYAKLGANVFITARREHLLKKVVQKCEKLGRKDATFGYLSTDMAKYQTSGKLLINAAAKHLGGIDHLILNHAILSIGHTPLWSGDEKDMNTFDKTMDINFRSYVYITSAALSHLYKSERGRIGVVGSMAGKIESMGMASYSASKFALDGFFSSLRTEMSNAGKNVSVTLCPLGLIGTDEGNQLVDALLNTYNVDQDKFYSIVTNANVTTTAHLLVDAVARGDRELYYPPFPGGLSPAWVPVLRHAAPWILDPEMKAFRKD